MRWLIVVVALCACGDDNGNGPCQEGETRPCYTGPPGTEGMGTCVAGVETCTNREFNGICIGDVTPFVEHCDGIDEDCNGEVDDVEGSGEECTNADGCGGTTACVGAEIGCVGPGRNACDVCDGVAVRDVGAACAIGNCSGQRVCNLAGDGTDCNAPGENECALCGGPAVTGLGDNCVATSGCPGQNVCNEDGDAATCDCNPQPGMCRGAGQLFRPVVAPQAGDLVVTEVMQSPSGDDALREWFEVLVVNDVDLNQVQLDRNPGDALQPNVIESVDCIRVTAGTRLVFARSLVAAENGNLPTPTAKFTFSLVGAGNIQILAPDGSVVDAVTWTSETGSAAMQLDPDSETAVANDTESNFCDATTPYDGIDLGTPGAPNVQCPIVVGPGQCLDIGLGAARDIVPPVVTQLIITEVLPNPAGAGTDATQEWFEIVNAGPGSFDLNNLVVQANTSSDTITSTNCLAVAQDTFALFARSANPAVNGGLPAVDAVFTFNLGNTNTTLSVLVGTTLIDAIAWTNQPQDGASRALLETQTSSVANDDQLNFCNGTIDYDGAGTGTNLGSPKAANDCVP